MPPKAKAAGRGRAPAKRKLAEEFPPGEVLKDTMKKEWKLGAPIGQGALGSYTWVRKTMLFEPIDNGPLFCELAFYMRAAKPDLIQSWMKSKKLKNLGVPRYWGSGRHERGGQRYRFMVIDRLGTDLQKKFEECGRRFPRKLVLQLGLRLLDTLEYIHEHEYVHADVKASNLMLSHSDPNQVYLVDYGLAYRYAPEGLPKEYKEDPKKCHDGTIEFTSIDCHKGASASRRSDLEILSYCMVQWLCGRLPWEDKLQDPLYVRDAKIRQENISEFMAKCFSSQDKPDEIQRFMEEVKSLGYTAKPPYDKLRSILQAGLKTIGPKEDGKLEFTSASGAAAPPTKKTTKRKMAADRAEESEVDSSPVKKKRVTKKNDRPKKSPQKTLKSRKVPSSDPKSRLVEMGTQTSPGLAQKSRGRPKKTST
uniref:non-specific serine/threonine protein kinase n=1 Tax=Maylandia zebra TaxID=106582 RepID=A0A3P9ATG5_9CICH